MSRPLHHPCLSYSQANLADFGDNQWVTCFQETAEALLGHSAETLGLLRHTVRHTQTHTRTHFGLFVVVRTLIYIMHSLTLTLTITTNCLNLTITLT